MLTQFLGKGKAHKLYEMLIDWLRRADQNLTRDLARISHLQCFIELHGGLPLTAINRVIGARPWVLLPARAAASPRPNPGDSRGSRRKPAGASRTRRPRHTCARSFRRRSRATRST